VNRPGLAGAAAITVGLVLGAGAIAQTPAEERAAPGTAAKKKDVDARTVTGSARREAAYAAAREKCNAFAGEVKANCLGNAEARFDKR